MKQLLTGLLLVITGLSFAQPSQQQVIDSMFKGIRTKFPDVGLVVGIYQYGQTSYYATGTRQKQGQALLDSASIFEIGSATKTFTALLLAEAIQEQKVRRDAFVDSYLPKDALPAPLRNKIRLTDLASHQSGLPNLSNDTYFADLLKRDPGNPFRFVDDAYLYTVLKETNSLYHHGKYQYNNYAFALLGAALRGITHKRYASLLQEGILEPFGMKHTTLALPATTNVAGLYNQQGKPQAYLVLNAVDPAGGLKSNAVDLIKYLKAHLIANPYSKAIRLIESPYYRDDRRTVGLGWDIKDDYYQKDGDTFGNSMLMRYSHARQLAIVVLSNHRNWQLVGQAVDFIYKGLSE